MPFRPQRGLHIPMVYRTRGVVWTFNIAFISGTAWEHGQRHKNDHTFSESVAPSPTCVSSVAGRICLKLPGDGSWWTPSQPSMQPMPQTAVLPPGGTMPQMMQTLICRLARTKIQVEEGWSLEVSSGKTLLILHFGGIRRIVMSDSNRQVVKRAAGS